MATDLAEFLGAALGFNLLFGVPLWAGGLLTAVATFLILGLERHGFRPLEAFITGLLAIIALCYVLETVLDRPDWGALLAHAAVPRFAGPRSVVLAAGILGATVMPHAIFLHSALTQERIRVSGAVRLRRLLRYEILDVVLAMGVASLVNAAILVMAAAAFFRGGLQRVASIEEAYRTLQPLLGQASGWVFALSLLVSGLSSSAVGTSAGQIIMQGFLQRQVPVWLRRSVTILPSLLVISLRLDPTSTLVASQVVLSFGLPFTLVPLVLFTRDRRLMGPLTNRRLTTLAASGVAGLIILLNLYLLLQLARGG